MFVLKSGGVDLPPPVSMKIDDEIIWSAETGRTLSAYMIGEAITQKKNIGLKWGLLTETELLTIKNTLVVGFFPLTFHDDGTVMTIDAYRGTLSKEVLGDIGDGVYWYRSATVDVIQR